MGARHLFLSELVEPECETFCEAAVVDEDDRRVVLFDELQDLRVNRRPDRALGSFRAYVLSRARFAHVLDGHDDSQVELLRDARVDQLDVARTRNEATDLRHRPLRRREPDPLERLIS